MHDGTIPNPIMRKISGRASKHTYRIHMQENTHIPTLTSACMRCINKEDENNEKALCKNKIIIKKI